MMTGLMAAWREVRAIVLGLAAFSAVAAFLRLRRWAMLSLGLLGGVAFFFRDPERQPTATGREWILSPADGTITGIDLIHEPHFFNGPAQRITIFLSLLDVHVQRAPYPGRVHFTRYQSGSFLPAFLRGADTNESHLIGFETERGPIGVQQVAGLLARRIVFWPELGDDLAAGERLGLIKFGSRVDLLLPANADIVAHVGQKVAGGQTVLARFDN
jgi:phosphatidylserine decarboxylase